jgi:TRAP-type mannitol/chloroaromatic compound transport system permease small subunit
MDHLPEILGGLGAGLIILFVIIVIFDAVLKAIGMWKAARRTQAAWFVCPLIFKTAGILPIIYFLTGGKKPENLEKT